MPITCTMPPAHHAMTGTSARRDLLIVAAGAALFWLLSVWLELNERVLSWTRPWERYQLDELPGVLLFLAAALAWYAWRRVREARRELLRRQAAEAKLAESLLENRRLSLSHVRLQEDERKQLARELHDELGQHLNALKIDAVSIRNWSEGQMAEVHAAARSMVQATDHVQHVIRDMLHRLRPVGLDELGLAAALEHLVAHWRTRNPAVHAALHVEGSLDDLGERANITLYRSVQEALTNVVKHACAGEVSIALSRSAQGIALTISDNGTGASDWSGGPGLGLVGMRERVEALGGALQIDSAAGAGFALRVALPAEALAA